LCLRTLGRTVQVTLTGILKETFEKRRKRRRVSFDSTPSGGAQLKTLVRQRRGLGALKNNSRNNGKTYKKHNKSFGGGEEKEGKDKLGLRAITI